MMGVKSHYLSFALYIFVIHWNQSAKCYSVSGANPELDAAFYIRNVCGVPLNYEYLPDDKLRNFCHDSFKKDDNEINRFFASETTKDQRKCYSFLCAWYQEKCQTIPTAKNFEFGYLMNKCNCLHHLWQLCSCNDVLNGKTDQVISQIHSEDEEIENFPIDVRFGRRPERDNEMDGYQGDSPDVERAFDDSDSFIFEEEIDNPAIANRADPFSAESYSEDEIKCLAIKQVWFDGKCVKLKSEEHCAPGEWLVFKPVQDSGDKLEPMCQQKKCLEKNEIWWASEGRCMKKTEVEKNYCTGKDVLVEHDPFGNGQCSCYDEAGSFEGSNDCYEFYQKGPCRIDQVVTYDASTGFAVCSKDLCFDLNHSANRNRPRRSDDITRRFGNVFEENTDLIEKSIDPYIFTGFEREFEKFDRFKRQSNKRKPASEKKFYAPFHGTGQCYRFGALDICNDISDDAKYNIHKVLKIPDCVSTKSTALHLVDGSPVCKVGQNGQCRIEVKLPHVSGAGYLSHLKNKLAPRG